MKEIYRVWKSPGFWFSIGLGVFSMLYPHMDTHYFWQTPLAYFASGDFLYFMLMPLTYGLIKLLLPFIAVLPAAAFLAEDQQRRYHLMLYHRYGAWGYMRHRMRLTVGAAMLAAAMGYLLYAVFAAFACPWHDHIVASWRNLSGFPFDHWVNTYEGIPFLLFCLFCLCSSSATWGLVGFAISCISNNSGIVIGGTFCVYYLISWVFSNVFGHWDWSPMVLQAPSIHYEGSIAMIIVRLLVWFAIALIVAIGCAGCFQRRMKEGQE